MKRTFISSFWLKIIAIITMTIDHIGVLLYSFKVENPALGTVGLIFRCIGRLSLPLFIFLAVEGALHTKSKWKYMLRLGCVFLPIFLFQGITEIVAATTDINATIKESSIFLTLIFTVFSIWALEHKKKSYKFFIIIPITISILSFILNAYEAGHASSHLMIWWYPYFLRPQYDVFAMMLTFTFYGANKIVESSYKSHGLNPDLLKDTQNYRFTTNLISLAGLIICSFMHFSLALIPGIVLHYDPSIQLLSLFAGLLILFYNGQLGYHKKWFTISIYLYYPVHLILIYAIFTIILS